MEKVEKCWESREVIKKLHGYTNSNIWAPVTFPKENYHAENCFECSSSLTNSDTFFFRDVQFKTGRVLSRQNPYAWSPCICMFFYVQKKNICLWSNPNIKISVVNFIKFEPYVNTNRFCLNLNWILHAFCLSAISRPYPLLFWNRFDAAQMIKFDRIVIVNQWFPWYAALINLFYVEYIFFPLFAARIWYTTLIYVNV